MSKKDDSVSTLLGKVKATDALAAEIKHDIAQLKADYPWVAIKEQVAHAKYEEYLKIKGRQAQINKKIDAHKLMLQDCTVRINNKMYHVYDAEDRAALDELSTIFKQRGKEFNERGKEFGSSEPK